MKHFRVLVGLWVLAAGPAVRADLRSFLYPTEPDVIVNTDVLDPSIPAPTPDHPLYYLPVSKGYRQFGYEAAGEKIPEPDGVLKMIAKILEEQGYQRSTDAHEPAIMILYSWGTFYCDANPYAIHSFKPEMLEFLGATKVGLKLSHGSRGFPDLDPELRPINPDSSTIEGFLPHGMYVITFWAFDFAEAMKGEARLLWKTNVSSSTRGFFLPEVLPTMLAVAAPLIGRETHRPIRIDVGQHYQPRVQLGSLRVLDEDVKLKERK